MLIAIGKDAASAALVGGWIATLANLYFAIQAFRYTGARSSEQVMRTFYRGEAGKFVIVMMLFLAAFLFSAFFLVYGVAVIAPLFMRD